MASRCQTQEPTGEDPHQRALRDFIHEQMRRHDWNYSAFARAIGTDDAVVRRWLRDRRPNPKLTRRMARRLGVDQTWLLTLVGHRSPPRGEVTPEQDVTPEQAALIEKVRQVPMTRERFLTLDALLEGWRREDLEVSAAQPQDSAPALLEHPEGDPRHPDQRDDRQYGAGGLSEQTAGRGRLAHLARV